MRLTLLAVLLGGAAGFTVLGYGGSSAWSMTATFFGAFLPLLWSARNARKDHGNR